MQIIMNPAVLSRQRLSVIHYIVLLFFGLSRNVSYGAFCDEHYHEHHQGRTGTVFKMVLLFHLNTGIFQISSSSSQQRVYNGNWTEWSAIWSEIICVISKSNKHAAQVRFEITSMISDQNCTSRSSITTLLDQFSNCTI